MYKGLLCLSPSCLCFLLVALFQISIPTFENIVVAFRLERQVGCRQAGRHSMRGEAP